jgi:tight adherence protein C
MLLMPRRAAAIDRRLEELVIVPRARSRRGRASRRWSGCFKRVGERRPKSPKELGALRLRLVQAGYRRDEALTIFFGIRVSLALLLFALLDGMILVAEPDARARRLGFGYVLPGMVLARLAKRRAHKIRLALADALDLLVVSVEAGLGLDQALRGWAASWPSPTRSSPRSCGSSTWSCAPASRAREALRNLADRTGVDDLSSLVTMLIQTDKFGTSVAQSLRVYPRRCGPSGASAPRRPPPRPA